jgi:hypothetical protein
MNTMIRCTLVGDLYAEPLSNPAERFLVVQLPELPDYELVQDLQGCSTRLVNKKTGQTLVLNLASIVALANAPVMG